MAWRGAGAGGAASETAGACDGWLRAGSGTAAKAPAVAAD